MCINNEKYVDNEYTKWQHSGKNVYVDMYMYS